MLLKMSITASILIVLISVIRFFFHEKLPKMTFVVLWTVVLVRLLVPMSFYTEYSLQGFINSTTDTPTTEVMPKIDFLDYTPTTSSDTVMPSPTINLRTVLLIYWITGAMITVTFFTMTYFKMRQNLRFALPIKDNDFIKEWQLNNQCAQEITILSCDQITTPVATGIFNPKIFLPKQMNLADTVQLEYILAHEFYHIKRFDALWKLIAIFALCVHWFNPLVWGMCILANRDLEITCDAWVVKKFGLASKKTYAFTLIGMAEQKKAFMPLYSGFARNATEERIKSIMKSNQPSLAGIFVAVLIIPLFALSAFATPSDTSSDEILYGNEQEFKQNDVIIKVSANEEMTPEPEPICEENWDGQVMGINTDPTQGYTTGIQAFLDTLECWNDAIILSTHADGVVTSRFYESHFSEMWEVELNGQRYIITSWRSTNPAYPHAYEIRIENN